MDLSQHQRITSITVSRHDATGALVSTEEIDVAAEVAKIRAARAAKGQGMRRVQNVTWVQSLAGWAFEDTLIALKDAANGISYHELRPSLNQVRDAEWAPAGMVTA